jgi:hypothetical protein
MQHGVRHIMAQDVGLDDRVASALQQADLEAMHAAARVTAAPVVHRVRRRRQGGGFGDAGRRPLGWALVVVIDGQPHRLVSARGGTREWSSLERLERWLLDQGFRSWLVVNDLEASAFPSLAPLAPWW